MTNSVTPLPPADANHAEDVYSGMETTIPEGGPDDAASVSTTSSRKKAATCCFWWAGAGTASKTAVMIVALALLAGIVTTVAVLSRKGRTDSAPTSSSSPGNASIGFDPTSPVFTPPSCSDADLLEEKIGYVELSIQGLPPHALPHQKHVLENLFRDVYNTISGMCLDSMSRIMLDANLTRWETDGQIYSVNDTYVSNRTITTNTTMEKYDIAATQSITTTYWESKLQCVDCPEGEPMFDLWLDFFALFVASFSYNLAPYFQANGALPVSGVTVHDTGSSFVQQETKAILGYTKLGDVVVLVVDLRLIQDATIEVEENGGTPVAPFIGNGLVEIQGCFGTGLQDGATRMRPSSPLCSSMLETAEASGASAETVMECSNNPTSSQECQRLLPGLLLELSPDPSKESSEDDLSPNVFDLEDAENPTAVGHLDLLASVPTVVTSGTHLPSTTGSNTTAIGSAPLSSPVNLAVSPVATALAPSAYDSARAGIREPSASPAGPFNQLDDSLGSRNEPTLAAMWVNDPAGSQFPTSETTTETTSDNSFGQIPLSPTNPLVEQPRPTILAQYSPIPSSMAPGHTLGSHPAVTITPSSPSSPGSDNQANGPQLQPNLPPNPTSESNPTSPVASFSPAGARAEPASPTVKNSPTSSFDSSGAPSTSSSSSSSSSDHTVAITTTTNPSAGIMPSSSSSITITLPPVTQEPTGRPTANTVTSSLSITITLPPLTQEPTGEPTPEPSPEPTAEPTLSPTPEPMPHPTSEPSTALVTSSPTSSPLTSPSTARPFPPSSSTTVKPTMSPAMSPLQAPSEAPSGQPPNPSAPPNTSALPTRSPVRSPSHAPSGEPSTVANHGCGFVEEQQLYYVFSSTDIGGTGPDTLVNAFAMGYQAVSKKECSAVLLDIELLAPTGQRRLQIPSSPATPFLIMSRQPSGSSLFPSVNDEAAFIEAFTVALGLPGVAATAVTQSTQAPTMAPTTGSPTVTPGSPSLAPTTESPTTGTPTGSPSSPSLAPTTASPSTTPTLLSQRHPWFSHCQSTTVTPSAAPQLEALRYSGSPHWLPPPRVPQQDTHR
ncbi:Inherit from NOG: Serine repeat antigen [Seminavis robusta]|uniref:Inherit from NOG: Serine repeat antigen n=1 Tax=Seminavis robusta TaxID=568900 RepID=A0A9N8H0Z3_9STRA|nr:Inherit from NOG: Serine repeat antigen [Seminavis robusta]|eukprot:Sro8_g006720.1 Inherit from NOG: Serine repeat antigen (1064) ;mRNA; f:131936-135127